MPVERVDYSSDEEYQQALWDERESYESWAEEEWINDQMSKLRLDIWDDNFKYQDCPCCGFSWQGDVSEKPKKISKLVGIENPYIYDGISWWKCPDCGMTWDRWTGEPDEIIEGKPKQKDDKLPF